MRPYRQTHKTAGYQGTCAANQLVGNSGTHQREPNFSDTVRQINEQILLYKSGLLWEHAMMVMLQQTLQQEPQATLHSVLKLLTLVEISTADTNIVCYAVIDT